MKVRGKKNPFPADNNPKTSKMFPHGKASMTDLQSYAYGPRGRNPEAKKPATCSGNKRHQPPKQKA